MNINPELVSYVFENHFNILECLGGGASDDALGSLSYVKCADIEGGQ